MALLASDFPSSWQDLLRADLDRLSAAHLLRRRTVVEAIDATHVQIDGRTYVNFSSNDYLGLTHHPAIAMAATQAIEHHGFGSGAAPLITGHSTLHDQAERAIAAWKHCQAALLLPSGYQANAAAIQTAAAIGRLHPGQVRFLVDKLAHASLIDAIRSTGADYRVFPHNHAAKLKRLLTDAPADQLQVVVTESIFSMDGDRADLAALAELKQAHRFLLILDEAHASGVYGPAGAGLAAELGLRDLPDVSVTTLSKALGGIGGAICGSDAFCQAVLNYGRAYLFSTAIPPAIAAAAMAAVRLLPLLADRQQRVLAAAARVRGYLTGLGVKLPPGDSPIVPIILGDEQAATTAATKLREMGHLVLPIRPPTVARGSSRLRVALSSEHTADEIDRLLAGLSAVCHAGG